MQGGCMQAGGRREGSRVCQQKTPRGRATCGRHLIHHSVFHPSTLENQVQVIKLWVHDLFHRCQDFKGYKGSRMQVSKL